MNAKEYRAHLAETFSHILEEKQLDWKKGWSGGGIHSPYNAHSGHQYKGINRFYLSLIAMQRKYHDPRWATFHQIKENGWRLNNAKGQGVKVEYWFPYDTEEKKMVSWQKFHESGEEFGERYLLRAQYSTVFGADLIEGIPALPKPEKKQIEPDQLITTLSKNMGVEILHDGGNRAFYRPSEDKIHLPVLKAFNSEYAYGSTALHELGHATGAPHRLNRNMSGHFGSPAYAYEELIAEISSCFMSANLRMDQQEEHIENHKAYVQSWIHQIREKPETLIKAIQEAEKVAAYMEYHAELIPREEFEKVHRSTLAINDKFVHPDLNDTWRLRVEQAYRIDDDYYLFLQGSEEGYDYTLYNRLFLEMDGGRLDVDLPPDEARDEILKLHELSFEKIEEIPIEEYELRREIQQVKQDTDLFNNILVIREYEKSIGRSQSMIYSLKNEEGIRAYAMRCKRYLQFGREVDQSIQGELPMREALKVCDTPQIMRDVGCEMLPMHITQKHLQNCMRDKNEAHPHHHGLRIEEIKRLPEELENPAVLSQSLSRKDSIVAILGYRERNGLPIMISIIPDGKASYHLEWVDSNFITSAYGKENAQDFVRRMAENDKLLYMNKEKSEELALLPLQLRQDHPAPAFNCIIKRMGEGVKDKNGIQDMVKERDEQKGEEQTMETGVRRIKAERLPEGWTWEMESDGSGHLRSPKGNNFFIFDRTTGECRRTEKERWNFDYYDDLQEDFTNFRELAERWIERKVLGKEIRPRKIDMKL